MRPLRARRPVDDHTASLARARVAQLTAAGRAPGGEEWLGGERHEVDGGALGDERGDDDVGRNDPDDRLDSEPFGDRPADTGRAAAPEWLDALEDRLPMPLRKVRFGLERGHVAVVVLVVLLGVVGAVVVFGLARPEVVPVESEVTSAGTPVDTEPATADPSAPPDPGDGGAENTGPMVVHVAGLVARPGVVELAAGSRVVDAIEAAGGATPAADLTPLNLARVLSDGEQVLVTAEPPASEPVPPAGQDGAAGAQAGPVNLNTATAAELETLPGIGPTLAGRILEWRAQNGSFGSVDELREVSGIGEQRFADLEPLVTL